MTERVPCDPELIRAAARLAGLSLTDERIAQLVPAMDGFFTTLDALNEGDLGETAPAFAYRAGWGAR